MGLRGRDYYLKNYSNKIIQKKLTNYINKIHE